MGERGHDHVRSHYGLSRVAERWEELYREVLARKGLVLAPRVSGVGEAEARGRNRRCGRRRTPIDLQILLPEVETAPPDGVVQLTILVDPVRQSALLQVGAERMGGGRGDRSRACRRPELLQLAARLLQRGRDCGEASRP